VEWEQIEPSAKTIKTGPDSRFRQTKCCMPD
jgi:hypothetical protein